jgi:hypothetical protein
VKYIPKPVDTSKIYLDDDLGDLVDYLAKNTHENWAAVRISQGWQYGVERSDAHKEHPCLVPYESLPESEKEHDRTVVRELLKTLHSLGFEIRKSKNRDDP